MYLLDTDVLIWILRNRKDIVDKVSKLKESAPVSISVMSVAEIYKNVFPAELVTTEEFIDQHPIFTIDRKIAKIAGLYWQEYGKRFKTLGIVDCLIAATANVNDLTLVSLNIKHFPMKDIQILDPRK